MKLLNYNSIKVLIVIHICLINITTANAADPESFAPYNFVGVKAGLVQPTPLYGNTGLDTGKPTSTAGILIGTKFHKILSIDLEYMHRGKNTTENTSPGETGNSTSWSAESNTVMLNLSMDIITDSRITPYLRGGAGIARNESYTYTIYDPEIEENSYYPGKTTNNFAWQAGIGANFELSSKTITTIEYMFVNRGSLRTESYHLDENGAKYNTDDIHAHLTDHIITFGLKMKF